MDEESQAHIEEQIKRQLAGKPEPVPAGFQPRNSISPKDIPATLGDPQLTGSLPTQVPQWPTFYPTARMCNRWPSVLLTAAFVCAT